MKSSAWMISLSLFATACGSGAPDGPTGPGLEVRQVAIYQGLKRVLVGPSEGAEVPIISGRPALFRVFFDLRPDLLRCGGEGALTLRTEGQAQVLRRGFSLNGSSAENALFSTLNFDVPGELMIGRPEWSLELELGPGCADTTEVRVPAAPAPPLTTVTTGTLRVTVVPFRYRVDEEAASLPDLTGAQLALYRETLLSMFPVENVVLSVREPVDWNERLDDLNGWNALLNRLYEVRADDRPPDATYYYGVVQPTDYAGPVVGLASLPSPDDVARRGGVGLGYAGPRSAATFAHELGHALGRGHAPCGQPPGPDPTFPPGRDGAIGLWGFDPFGVKFLEPSRHRDFMSYCGPEWVSDHTFAALTERLSFVLGAEGFRAVGEARFRFVTAFEGGLRGSRTLTARLPSGPDASVRYYDGEGRRLGAGVGVELEVDHLDARKFAVPEAPPETTWIEIEGFEGAWPPPR